MPNKKKYVSLTRLSEFLDNLRAIFVSKADYIVDEELSSDSVNPVQNKVIDAELEEISRGMGALELALDGKSDSEHNHDDRYYTEDEIDTKISEINGAIDGKSDSEHTHIIEDVNGLNESLESKVPVVRTINGHALTEDITLNPSDIGADPADSAASALREAKEYTDEIAKTVENTYETKVNVKEKFNEAKLYTDALKNELLNGAGYAYDTLKELGDLIDDNTDAIGALEKVASGKAGKVHSHIISDVDNLQLALDTIEENVSQKSQIQIITWEADD